MALTISKQFDFDAAHFLPKVEDGHKCKRLHGHTYRVEIGCTGEIDDRGMICDYAEIASAWRPIEGQLDHYCLNDIAGLENPTTEILSVWILTRIKTALPMVAWVRVYESATTWCEARP